MSKYLKINAHDNVAVALFDLKKGDNLDSLILCEDIPFGHKFALVNIKENENVIKYGYPIGHAKKEILKGEHVHSDNLVTNLEGKLNYNFDRKIVKEEHLDSNIKVRVFPRKFNRYGIRNNLVIVPLVGCVNHQAELIKENFLKEIDKNLIDDVIVCEHPYGCSQLGGDLENTIKVLQAIVKHPNNGGVLVLSLGCENNQIENFKKTLNEYDENRVKFLKAQAVEDEVLEGTNLCLELYKEMINDKRILMPLSVITIGLKCGGSDGLSGITANPLVGLMSDYIIKNGGSSILSEVPEMFGAEQILMKRSDTKETFTKIVDLVNNFKGYYENHHQVCYENPSPGNKAGGITTLEEKSLGCVQKAGHEEVKDVLYAGDLIKIKGLNLLNGPGNDIVACTNIACSGAQLILFTTGRGTPFGTFVPTVKISTNNQLFEKKKNWIDFNAGEIADGKDINYVFDDFSKFVLDVINGDNKTSNEKNGFEEIAIFKDGVTL